LAGVPDKVKHVLQINDDLRRDIELTGSIQEEFPSVSRMASVRKASPLVAVALERWIKQNKFEVVGGQAQQGIEQYRRLYGHNQSTFGIPQVIPSYYDDDGTRHGPPDGSYGESGHDMAMRMVDSQWPLYHRIDGTSGRKLWEELSQVART
jgi:hypothetical protein